MMSFSAPIHRRLTRLRRLGATVDPPVARKPMPRATLMIVTGILAPLIVLVYGMLLFVALATVGISLAIDMMFLMPMVAAAHYLLRHVLHTGLGS